MKDNRQKVLFPKLIPSTTDYCGCSQRIPLLRLTPEGIINCANDCFCRIASFRAKEKLLGHFIGEYAVHPEGKEWFSEGIRQLRLCEADIVRNQCEIYSDKGFPILLDIILMAKRNSLGELCSISCILQDIVLPKQAEPVHAELSGYAGQRQQWLTASLAGISHYIRTPMHAMVGFSELLYMADTQDEKDEYVSVIRNTGRLIAEMLKSVLDLELLDAGQFKLQLDLINLTELGREVCASSCVVNDKKEVRILFEETKDPDFSLKADRIQLRRVLTNLLGNAMKNTTSGEIKLSYEVKTDSVMFLVSDTGCGIPQDKLSVIFNRYERLSTDYKGFGLGLAICRSLVNAMEGEIRATSIPGKGSMFYFTLPIK